MSDSSPLIPRNYRPIQDTLPSEEDLTTSDGYKRIKAWFAKEDELAEAAFEKEYRSLLEEEARIQKENKKMVAKLSEYKEKLISSKTGTIYALAVAERIIPRVETDLDTMITIIESFANHLKTNRDAYIQCAKRMERDGILADAIEGFKAQPRELPEISRGEIDGELIAGLMKKYNVIHLSTAVIYDWAKFELDEENSIKAPLDIAMYDCSRHGELLNQSDGEDDVSLVEDALDNDVIDDEERMEEAAIDIDEFTGGAERNTKRVKRTHGSPAHSPVQVAKDTNVCDSWSVTEIHNYLRLSPDASVNDSRTARYFEGAMKYFGRNSKEAEEFEKHYNALLIQKIKVNKNSEAKQQWLNKLTAELVTKHSMPYTIAVVAHFAEERGPALAEDLETINHSIQSTVNSFQSNMNLLGKFLGKMG